jgi:hypothetical protein
MRRSVTTESACASPCEWVRDANRKVREGREITLDARKRQAFRGGLALGGSRLAREET